ncbi:MAG TPA: NAD(P)(+) transhydrogenase (Re/Si-specific) subunit beta [Bryobacteraceae bacterium]|nr:NAD(P)(+) transhydrogenase (Re/Si-specific) subunit beta [Bryobacteraceae bacterium]
MNVAGYQILYIIAAASFILALMWMSSPATARRGVLTGEAGMLLAVVATLLRHEVVNYDWIVAGLVIGSAIGIPIAIWMPMTQVPQRTAISQACGALASALIGTAEYYRQKPHGFVMGALGLEMLLGFLTTTASVMAFGKLNEMLPSRPITFKGQNIANLGLLGVAVVIGGYLVVHPEATYLFPIFVLLALIFGVLLIIPIGGADMPTVIALLNSYAGLSACSMGFALDNKLLIIAGALDGSSGFILSIIMCRAMNRSFTNVLFGGFGQLQTSTAAGQEARPVRSATAEEAAGILADARSVVVIPGYGMAVAQAQHKIRELHDVLMKRGVDVRFAIHPVAGRMPGHMNVLLAEADVPYDKLIEMEDINSDMGMTDVALIVGANDIVNPAALNDPGSPIAGMPILDAYKARTIMIIKRGMSAGFAGIDNELYYMDKTLMLFGDAKAFVASLVKEIGSNHD